MNRVSFLVWIKCQLILFAIFATIFYIYIYIYAYIYIYIYIYIYAYIYMCMQEDRETTFSLTSRKSYLGDRLSNQRKFLSRTFSYQPSYGGIILRLIGFVAFLWTFRFLYIKIEWWRPEGEGIRVTKVSFRQHIDRLDSISIYVCIWINCMVNSSGI